MTTTPSIVEHLSSSKDIALMVGEIFGIFVVGLCIGLMGAIKKNKSSFKFTQKQSKLFSEQHSRIHEMLTELRVVARASRCIIFQFHNSGSFADGTSIKRFSVTHESSDPKVSSILLESQDVFLTRYTDIVPIMERQAGEIIDVNNISSSVFRSGLEINNVEYFSIIPLKCVDGLTPLGFVCCHWCSAELLNEIEKEGISRNKLQELIINTVQNINTHLTHIK